MKNPNESGGGKYEKENESRRGRYENQNEILWAA